MSKNLQHRILTSRRSFLASAVASSVLAGAGLGSTRSAQAAVDGPVLASMFLNGGPDHRHLFMPAFTPGAGSYGNRFWRARARAQKLTGTGNAVMDTRWNDGYFARSGGGVEFGILKKAPWLKDMWDAGNVAIVSNVVGDDSRDHENAIRSMELGNRVAEKLTRGSGWGGRAAVAAGGKAVSLTRSTRTFCLGPHPDAPRDLERFSSANVVPAADVRNLQPYQPAPGQSLGRGDHVARSLNAYYAAKRLELDEDSPFTRFLEHERKLREFGEMLDTRLVANPLPQELVDLGHFDDKIYNGPVDSNLAQQMRNLHDAMLTQDLLEMRVASTEYNGWDTHDEQGDEVEYRIEALYGADQAFDRLWRNLSDEARARLVVVVCGEFGRQLHDNGGNGTDHGTGNDVILIGEPVRGGIYGDKFPGSELDVLDDEGSDIAGLTAIDHVFGAVCNWLEPGSASTVFPNIASAPLEPGLGLANLLG